MLMAPGPAAAEGVGAAAVALATWRPGGCADHWLGPSWLRRRVGEATGALIARGGAGPDE